MGVLRPHDTDLVHNPPSLQRLCVYRIRQAISSMGQNVEKNLIQNLAFGDFNELKYLKLPFYLKDMCQMEKKLVWESCFNSGAWGLLEMHILLTDDIVEFGLAGDVDISREVLMTPAMYIQLPFINHKDLLLSFLMVRCPKLESLAWYSQTTSQTALEKFCAAMTHMIELFLPHANLNDGVLRAISGNMHHLQYLDIPGCYVEPKSIEHLLPARDNALGGCPHLVELDLSYNTNVDVKLLKKIILALPKLRSLKHELLVYALEDLTEEEMGEDTARSLNRIYSRHFIRFDILAKSPVFQRLNKSITAVDMEVPRGKHAQRRFASLTNVLKCLPMLKWMSLCSISEAGSQVLPLLESIGNRLKYLELFGLTGNLSVNDIMRTCVNVVKLKLSCELMDESLNNTNNLHQEDVKPIMVPVLNYLTKINLTHLNKDVCSAKMLMALLQSPWLKKITLSNVEVMSDDVMMKVLSSGCCTALSKVTKFTVHHCPLITASPFVHWLTREKCLLEYISFHVCDKVDYNVIRDAAEECPRALIIEDRIFVKDDDQ